MGFHRLALVVLHNIWSSNTLPYFSFYTCFIFIFHQNWMMRCVNENCNLIIHEWIRVQYYIVQFGLHLFLCIF